MKLWSFLMAVTLPAAPLTLRQAVERTAGENPDVQLARLRVVELEIEAARAKSAFGPQLNAVAGQSYNTTNLQGVGLVFPGFPSRVGPYRIFNLRPVLTQKLCDPALLLAVRAARERARGQEHDAAAVREQAVFAVVRIYLDALEARSRLALARARETRAAEVLRQIEDKERAGAVSRLDTTRAAMFREKARAEVDLASRDAEALTVLLQKAMGLAATGPVELEEVAVATAPPSGTVEDTVREATGERPEFRALDVREGALKLELEAARRERLPRVDFSGDFGLLGAGPERSVSTYSVGITATVPLWTSGRAAQSRKAAENRLAASREEKRRLTQAVSEQVAQAYLEHTAANKAVSGAKASAEAAREALELWKLRFEAGLATQVDVVTAQTDLAEAEELEVRIRYQGYQALAKLAHARGDAAAFAR